MWIIPKIPIYIGFVHKIAKWSDFQVDIHVLKVKKLQTRMSQIWSQNIHDVKRKTLIILCGKSYALVQ